MSRKYKEIYMPNHPNARSNGTILEHRYIAEQKLGRYLTSDEVVHHVDENKRNNNPDNLIVFRTAADHSRYHKIGILKEMEDGTYICPIPEERIRQCPYCKKYFISSSDFLRIHCSNECRIKDDNERFENREDRPDKETLSKLIYSTPFTKIAEMYNVSDNAVRRWCKKYDLPYRKNDIIPKNKIERKHAFLLRNHKIHMFNTEVDMIFEHIEEVITYLRVNKNINTVGRNIQTSISQAIKHNKKYQGFNWEIL